MAHYAKLDENNIVIDVIVVNDVNCLDENGNENEEKGRQFCQGLTGHANWKKTSYNTRRGVYYNQNTDGPHEDQTKAFRVNYAVVGYKYNEELDAFVENVDKKIFPRMILDSTTGTYKLPRPSIPEPEDLQLEQYPEEEYRTRWHWNEIQQQWIKVNKNLPLPEGTFNWRELI
jgi:hypothetical protein